jgi:hypothetical protein
MVYIQERIPENGKRRGVSIKNETGRDWYPPV